MTASKDAAWMAVTPSGDTRSTGARERMMWMTRIAVVGMNATAPSAAGTMRGIAISPGLPERQDLVCRDGMRQRRAGRGW
jgi:hypothetical protein